MVKKTLMSRTLLAQERYALWNAWVAQAGEQTIPHCDSRILHNPAICEYCDRPGWQAARKAMGIAWTGQEVIPDGFVRCEADVVRPPDSEADHRRWGGNKPTSAFDDPSWPEETLASQIFYGGATMSHVEMTDDEQYDENDEGDLNDPWEDNTEIIRMKWTADGCSTLADVVSAVQERAVWIQALVDQGFRLAISPVEDDYVFITKNPDYFAEGDV